MSYYRENVTWQSPDGTWNRGFFAEDYLTCGGNEEECGDETHEWCREFDQGRFSWVATGLPTEEAAWRSWDGANPGGTSTVGYDPASPDSTEWVAGYEDMAAVACEEAARAREAAKARAQASGRYWYDQGDYGYMGPVKRRSLLAMKKERDAYVEGWASTHLQGYANMRQIEEEAHLDGRIAEHLKTATADEKAAYDAAHRKHAERLRGLLADHAKRESERRRYPSYSSYGYRPGELDRARQLGEARRDIKALAEQVEQSKPAAQPPVPSKKAPTRKATGRDPSTRTVSAAARGKTTARSNQTSFAPKQQTQADAGAFPGGGSWGSADSDELPL